MEGEKMLTLYRRHTCSCGQKDRYYRRCKCPVWVEGTTNAGNYVRHSLRLTSWERGEEKKRELETGPVSETSHAEPPAAPQRITVREATEKFCKECEARRLSEATMRKYRTLAKQIREFASTRLVDLNEFTTESAREFRSSWKDGPRAAGKKLERLRAFFRFAMENGWIEESPAKYLKPPIVKDTPTLPFGREDMARIIEHAGDNRLFILTMRYTGMRISDTAMFQAMAVNGNKVFLYTHKTGVPVYVPIPEFVANDLASIQLARVFKNAKIPNGHPHRFRDTFAVELLLAGVPIEQVSVLLGHASVKITEKHYAPWVRTRQEKLEEDVRKSWGEVGPKLVKPA
jgi:integrase